MQAQLYLWTVFGIFAISFGCFPEPPPVGDQLPSVASVNPNSITLGGFSSGASFATQVLAFSCFYVFSCRASARGSSENHFSGASSFLKSRQLDSNDQNNAAKILH